jgi:hypothetical protein
MEIENLQAVASRDALSGGAQPRQVLSSRRISAPEKQKVGNRPTVRKYPCPSIKQYITAKTK